MPESAYSFVNPSPVHRLGVQVEPIACYRASRRAALRNSYHQLSVISFPFLALFVFRVFIALDTGVLTTLTASGKKSVARRRENTRVFLASHLSIRRSLRVNFGLFGDKRNEPQR